NTLLKHHKMLEYFELDVKNHKLHNHFPVQYMSPPHACTGFHYFRVYMGRVVSGSIRVGDHVVVLPSRARTTVTGIVTHDGLLQEAFARQSVTLTLADDLDVGRGDMISCEPHPPQVRTEFKATLCWISEQKLHLNQRYTLRHTTKTVRAIIGALNHRLNVNT